MSKKTITELLSTDINNYYTLINRRQIKYAKIIKKHIYNDIFKKYFDDIPELESINIEFDPNDFIDWEVTVNILKNKKRYKKTEIAYDISKQLEIIPEDILDYMFDRKDTSIVRNHKF